MNPSAPLSYTVKRGDTLWDISAMYLRDPWLWPEIWHVNPAVQNPHLIYPGDVLTLAYGANGQPQVSLTRGNAVRVQPLVRSTPLEGPIATIPYDAITRLPRQAEHRCRRTTCTTRRAWPACAIGTWWPAPAMRST